MKRTDLLSRLAETLQAPPVSFSESTRLSSLSMWDSMGQLEVACLLVSRVVTVGDLLEFARHKLN